MSFIGYKKTVQLRLTTPLDFCCNCGDRGEVELVETPLQKTRYFLFFGSELELLETFPYCRRCKGSAKRTRLGWSSKLLVACAVSAAVFVGLVLDPDSLPHVIQTNLFACSIFVGVVIPLCYFYLRGRKSQRSYYQPVSLVATGDSDYPNRLHLKFTNASYARLFSRANSDLIAAGSLKVEVESAK